MKKLLSFAILAMCMFSLSSCDDDDDNPYVPQPVNVSTGAFIVNSGNSSSQIGGSLTYIDYATMSATQGVFRSANIRELGKTANDAVVYGSKMYIVVTGENTVEVVDKNTMVSLKQIKTTDANVLGSTNGEKPRHIIAGNKKVYVSTFAGYVAEIDTTSLEMTNSYVAGSYPEGMALDGDKLYVANSDYSEGVNPSISCIDLTDGTTTDFRDSEIKNPVGCYVINGGLYVLDSGSYLSVAPYTQIGAGLKRISNGTVTNVVDATSVAVYGSKIYVINNPYGATAITYSIYDLTNGQLSTFPIADGDKPFSPNAIGVDPVTGNVFIASYSQNHDTGFAGYSLPGYVNIYKQDGSFIKQLATGVGPTAITFNVGVVYE